MRHGLFVIAATATVLAACSSGGAEGVSPDSSSSAGQTAEQPQSGGSLTYAYQGQAPATLDGITGPSATGVPSARSAGAYFFAIFGALTYEDWSSGDVKPWMAKSLTMVDPTHWNLELRPGVQFSDGTAFDAAAVKFNWDLIASTQKAPSRAAMAQWVDTTTVASPTELQIALKAPNTEFDRTVARNFPFIGSPTAMQADPAGFGQKPVGAGPFVVKSFDQALNLTATRNPTYWDQPRPYLDELTLLNLSADPAQRYNTFASGQADIVSTLDAAGYPQAKSAGTHLIKGTEFANGGTNFVFNTTAAPFDDPDARRAFITALDSEAFNQALYGDAGTVQTGVFNQSSPYYTPDAEFPKHDAAHAQKLFDDYAAKHGSPMEIVVTSTTSGVNTTAANFIQTQLASFKNVTVTLNLIETATYVSELLKGNFDVALFNITTYDPLSDFSDFFTANGVRNFGHYSNADVEQLVAEGFAATARDERVKAVQQAAAILVRDAVLWYPAQLDNWIGVNDRVKALPFAVSGVFLWDQVWVKG